MSPSFSTNATIDEAVSELKCLGTPGRERASPYPLIVIRNNARAETMRRAAVVDVTAREVSEIIYPVERSPDRVGIIIGQEFPGALIINEPVDAATAVVKTHTPMRRD